MLVEDFMRLSNVLGSSVCSVFEGRLIGYTTSACFCEGHKKLSGFVVVNDDDEYEYFLPIKQIIGQNDQMLFVKNITSVSIQENMGLPSLINKKAYYLDGEFIGSVKDVVFNENYEVIQIIFDNLTLPPEELFNVGEDFCFFCEQDKRPKLNKFAPQKKSQIAGLSVQIMQAPPIYPSSIPPRIKAYDSISAIGKIATKTVLGKNNEIIVKKGEIVSLDCIKKAKQHNVYLSF